MTVFNILSCKSAKPSAFIKPPVIPQGSHVFKNAIGLYNRNPTLLTFDKSLPISARLDTRVLTPIKRSRSAAIILGSRSYCAHPQLAAASQIPFQLSHIEKKQSNQQVKSLIDKVSELNLQTITFSAEPIKARHEEITASPLNLAGRIATLDLRAVRLPVQPSISDFLDEETTQSFKQEMPVRWILTSHNMYGLAITLLHNFIDICCQKEDERNFINVSLVPRARYIGVTFSAATSVVYHVAIGILFTPLVAATLGRKKEINEIWYGYWAGASVSAMSVFAGVFGMISGNYLIHKTMEKSIPQFKSLLTRYLGRVEKICMRLNRVNFPQLKEEVKNVETTAEMVSVVQKLLGIAKSLYLHLQ